MSAFGGFGGGAGTGTGTASSHNPFASAAASATTSSLFAGGFSSGNSPFGAGTTSSTSHGTGFGGFSFQSQPLWGTSSSFTTASTGPGFGVSPNSKPLFTSTSNFGQPTAFGNPTWRSTLPAFGTGSSFVSNSSTTGSAFLTSSTLPSFSTSMVPATSTSPFPSFSASSFSAPSIFGPKPAFNNTATAPSFSFPTTNTSTTGTGFLFSTTPTIRPSSSPSFNNTSTAPSFPFSSTSTSTTGTGFLFSTTPTIRPSNSPSFNSTSTAPSFSFPSAGTSTTGTGFLFSTTPTIGPSSSPSFTFNSFPSPAPSWTNASTSSFFTPSSLAPKQSAFTPITSFPFSSTPTTPFSTRPVTPFMPPPNPSNSLPFNSTSTISFGPSSWKSTVSPPTWMPSASPSCEKLNSISGSPAYESKSHEELRWEDFQKTNKGSLDLFTRVTGDAEESKVQPMSAMRFYHGISYEEQRWADCQRENKDKSCPAVPTSNFFNTFTTWPTTKDFTSPVQTMPSQPLPTVPTSIFFNTSSTWPLTKDFTSPFQSMPSLTLPPASSQSAGASTATIAQTQPEASNRIGESMPGQVNAGQTISVTVPLGMVQAMSQVSLSATRHSPVRSGISSIPVSNKPAPVRVSSLLISRPMPMSRARIKLLPKRYHPKNDTPKVPFFNDEGIVRNDGIPCQCHMPRENPRAMFTNQWENWPSRAHAEKLSPPDAMPALVDTSPVKSQKSVHRVVTSATLCEDEADIETLLPPTKASGVLHKTFNPGASCQGESRARLL